MELLARPKPKESINHFKSQFKNKNTIKTTESLRRKKGWKLIQWIFQLHKVRNKSSKNSNQ